MKSVSDYFSKKLKLIEINTAEKLKEEIFNKTGLNTKVIIRENDTVIIPENDKEARRLEFSDLPGSKTWRKIMSRKL